MARTKGAKADKHWLDALRLAVNREEISEGQKRRRLSLIADKLCKLAMDGDVSAIKEIGDRLDGKPTQAVDYTGTMTVEHEVKDDADAFTRRILENIARAGETSGTGKPH